MVLFLFPYICDMQRYFIELSYDGSDYLGWQKQAEGTTVQETIEIELSKLNSNETIAIVGCGRTDTGVHAHHFMIHADMPEVADTEKFIFKLNRMLPDSIAIHSMQRVSADLHARFSAKARTYRYFIHRSKNVFKTKQSWLLSKNLDYEAMNAAAHHLLGTQDFTSLSKLHTDVKTNICTVTRAVWMQENGDWFFEITADRFLRNMVRATVGTLVDVGLGKLTPNAIPEILAAKDRSAASTSVPAHGLFLWKIEYDGL